MQKHTTKRILAGGVLITAALFLSSCRETAEAEAEPSENVLVVGCDDYTPFSYMDVNGNLTGIDVELAREAFSRMGYEAEVTFINWEDKKKLLADGTIDCVWSSFTMDGREEEYRWAGPYMKSNQVVAVNMDSDIWSVSDLEGKTIAVQSTTKPEELFRTHADGIPAFRKIISVKKRDLIFTFLSKGYVDAIAAHDTSITQFMADFDMEFRILEEPLQTVNLGVAFDKNDTRGLDAELTRTLMKMRADGTVKDIVSRYLPDADRYLENENE